VLDQPNGQTQFLEHHFDLSLRRHLLATADEVRQHASEQCRGRLWLMQCQPLDEALAAALAGRNRIALVILLDESSRSDSGHDRLAQIATEFVLATFTPAAIAGMALLEAVAWVRVIEFGRHCTMLHCFSAP
jgi:hypothetical protein